MSRRELLLVSKEGGQNSLQFSCQVLSREDLDDTRVSTQQVCSCVCYTQQTANSQSRQHQATSATCCTIQEVFVRNRYDLFLRTALRRHKVDDRLDIRDPGFPCHISSSHTKHNPTPRRIAKCAARLCDAKESAR
jgi:hypothetical protein